jgi:hypothetical protein
MDKILVVMPDRHFGNLVISLNAIKPLRDQYGSENVAIVFSDMHHDMIAVGWKTQSFEKKSAYYTANTKIPSDDFYRARGL